MKVNKLGITRGNRKPFIVFNALKRLRKIWFFQEKIKQLSVVFMEDNVVFIQTKRNPTDFADDFTEKLKTTSIPHGIVKTTRQATGSKPSRNIFSCTFLL